MERALFIFRRDLRLEDNTALLFALKNAKEVILAFIFTPEQIDHNPYRSDRSLQFMIESLEDLTQEIEKKKGKLYLFFGHPEEIVEKCIQTEKVEGVFVNRDYTPYSIQRDQKIESVCKKHKIIFQSFNDALLHPPEETVKADGKPYTIFTPFYRNALRLKVAHPTSNHNTHYYRAPIPFAKDSSLYEKILSKRSAQQEGGRNAALKILKNLHTFSNYSHLRDFPSEEKSTHLSPHLKFTTISPRELYYAIEKHFGPDSDLIRSLFWRDFFTSIAFHFPRIFKGAFKTEFDRLTWSNEKKTFHLWCEGKTGFPIVDAGMRELNQTGFMHNRVRMIAASFLVKDLHIDWRWGEKYFAQTLIDYDPAVNNGNWQWVASTGCDAQPYFRIFNPWNQQSKFDPECLYIKHWIPELSSFSPKEIHSWQAEKHRSSYPYPIIDHSKESKLTLEQYKK
jgi:deoxyribodipyrimidine photo-lyase